MDGHGAKFVWVGNDGPIQMMLPVVLHEPLTCSLFVWPHPRVDFSSLRLIVNGVPCDHESDMIENGVVRISFRVNAIGAPKIDIKMEGLTSVRPCDIGDFVDERFLAFEFFGAEAVFDSASAKEDA